MAKPLPHANRISRKADPIGCLKAWWYLERNGGITIFGTSYDGKAFSCAIGPKGLKALRRVDRSTKNA